MLTLTTCRLCPLAVVLLSWSVAGNLVLLACRKNTTAPDLQLRGGGTATQEACNNTVGTHLEDQHCVVLWLLSMPRDQSVYCCVVTAAASCWSLLSLQELD